jgi:ABC-type sugar transport system substrate-binding protein
MIRRHFLKLSAVAAILASTALPAFAADLKVMTTLPSFREPFFVYMQEALNKAGEKHGLEIIEADGEGDSNTQSAHIDRAIAMGVNGIIISPIDVNALAPAIEEAIKAGIPVVTIDRRVEGVDGLIGHVGADNIEGGRAQGRWVKKHFPDGARILNIRGRPGSSPAIDRNAGLHKELDGDDKYVFVAEQTANWLRDEAYRVTETIFAGLDKKDYPTVVVSASDAMGFGVLEAMEQFGVRKTVPQITFDAAPATLASIKDGTAKGGFAATIDQWPGAQSEAAVVMLKNFLVDGKRPEKEITLIAPGSIGTDNLSESERFNELSN